MLIVVAGASLLLVVMVRTVLVAVARPVLVVVTGPVPAAVARPVLVVLVRLVQSRDMPGCSPGGRLWI